MLRRDSSPRCRSEAAPVAPARRAPAWRALAAGARVVGCLGVLAGLAFGAQRAWLWATSTPFFALETIVVRGAERATRDELVSLGSLALGMNLVALDGAAIEDAMDAHPWVKAVNVRRRFPRALEVSVEEHRPVALAAFGGRLYLVDGDGTPFKRLQPREGIDLPLVTGLGREAVAAAGAGSLEALRLAVALLERYVGSPAGRRHRPSEVHFEGEAVTLALDDGPRVLLGEVDLGTDAGRARLDEQLERLELVARELRARGVAAEQVRLDNRSRPAWITVTPRSAPGASGAERGKPSARPAVEAPALRQGAAHGPVGALADAAMGGRGAVPASVVQGVRQARTEAAERQSRARQ